MIKYSGKGEKMGRTRRKVVKIFKRKLPELFLCPKCGKNTVKATIDSKESRARVVCSNCELKSVFSSTPNMAEVDAYCLFVDNYYLGTGGGTAIVGLCC